MEVKLEAKGNPGLSVMNKTIKIKSGDSLASVYLSVNSTASEFMGFLFFTKIEGANIMKYQEILPLEIAIQLFSKIEISCQSLIQMYMGSKSYFQEVLLGDLTNVNVSVSVESNNNNLTILGEKILNFSATQRVQRFRLFLKENSNATFDFRILLKIVSGTNSKLFQLKNEQIIVKIVPKPQNLNNKSMIYLANIQISSKTIDLLISKFNYPVFFYYQIYRKLQDSSLEMTIDNIIQTVDTFSDSKQVSPNMILGFLNCNDTNKVCREKFSNLDVEGYYIKGIAASPLIGVRSETTFTQYFEPFRKKIR